MFWLGQNLEFPSRTKTSQIVCKVKLWLILEIILFSSVSKKVDNQCLNVISTLLDTILKYDTEDYNQDDAFFQHQQEFFTL